MSIDVQAAWIRNLQFVARAGSGPAVVLDTPDGKSGAGPMELVLMGTAGCTAMDVVSILKKKRMGAIGKGRS